MKNIRTVLFVIVLISSKFSNGDYNNYYEYVEVEEDYEIPEVFGLEEGDEPEKGKALQEIVHYGLVSEAKRGDIVKLNCTSRDLGGCAKRFLTINNNQTAALFEQENLDVVVEGTGSYTCGCASPAENLRNITYTMILKHDNVQIFKDEYCRSVACSGVAKKFHRAGKSLGNTLLYCPLLLKVTWIIFIWRSNYIS